jgi:hypothetical protein
VFGSLDYIYLPTADVDGEVLRYVKTMGAELVWKVRAMRTTVACLGAGEPGPAILLSGHLQGTTPILVYQVQDYADTIAWLRHRKVSVCELEIPTWPVRHVHDGDGPAVRGLPAHAARCGSSV